MDLLESVNSPLAGTCKRWTSLIAEAKKIKHELFGKYAEECQKFFDSDHNFMWDREYATKQGGYISEDSFGATGMPTFRVCVNKPFEAVALFGPALYHRNPNIVVQPKNPPRMEPIDLGFDENDPYQQQAGQAAMQQQEMARRKEDTTGKLCQHYLNWLQLESDKKLQSRRAINDAIVRGLGILWTEIYAPPNSSVRYPRSVYVRETDVIKDPDARYAEDVQWVARRCVHPVNLVEEKYGFAPGTLRGQMQSLHSQQSKRAQHDRSNGKKDSKSFDTIEYWEVYSKNGAGQHLKKGDKDYFEQDFDLSVFGKYCYFAFCDSLPFPLNIPPELVKAHSEEPTPETEAALFDAAQWPIPFWEDEGCNNGWPFAELSFYEATDHIWPIPLIKPAIGEIRFVNWALSFLADKTAASCKSYIGIAKAEVENIKQQGKMQLGPFTVLEISQLTGKNINEVISMIEGPSFDKGLFEMVLQVMEIIDRRTGLTELIYGQSARQLRSAEEARIKNENTTIRPDEMASRVEDFLSAVAMKEMEAAVSALGVDDFLPVLGEFGTRVFADNVFVDDGFYERLVRNFTFRVEAGSARKPNKANKVDQLTQLSNFLLPTVQQFAVNGQMGPFNALMYDIADAMDLNEPERYLLQEPPMPPEQPGEDPEAEMELKQAELQMKQQAEATKLEMQRAKLEAELQAQQVEMELRAQEGQQNLALKQAEFQLDTEMQAQQHVQEMQIRETEAQQGQQLAQQKMKTEAVQAAHKATIAEKQSQAQIKMKEQQAKAAAKAKPKQSAKKKPKGK